MKVEFSNWLWYSAVIVSKDDSNFVDFENDLKDEDDSLYGKNVTMYQNEV